MMTLALYNRHVLWSSTFFVRSVSKEMQRHMNIIVQGILGLNSVKPRGNGRRAQQRSSSNGRQATVVKQRSSSNGRQATVVKQRSSSNGRQATVVKKRSSSNGRQVKRMIVLS